MLAMNQSRHNNEDPCAADNSIPLRVYVNMFCRHLELCQKFPLLLISRLKRLRAANFHETDMIFLREAGCAGFVAYYSARMAADRAGEDNFQAAQLMGLLQREPVAMKKVVAAELKRHLVQSNWSGKMERHFKRARLTVLSSIQPAVAARKQSGDSEGSSTIHDSQKPARALEMGLPCPESSAVDLGLLVYLISNKPDVQNCSHSWEESYWSTFRRIESRPDSGYPDGID